MRFEKWITNVCRIWQRQSVLIHYSLRSRFASFVVCRVEVCVLVVAVDVVVFVSVVRSFGLSILTWVALTQHYLYFDQIHKEECDAWKKKQHTLQTLRDRKVCFCFVGILQILSFVNFNSVFSKQIHNAKTRCQNHRFQTQFNCLAIIVLHEVSNRIRGERIVANWFHYHIHTHKAHNITFIRQKINK